MVPSSATYGEARGLVKFTAQDTPALFAVLRSPTEDSNMAEKALLLASGYLELLGRQDVRGDNGEKKRNFSDHATVVSDVPFPLHTNLRHSFDRRH